MAETKAIIHLQTETKKGKDRKILFEIASGQNFRSLRLLLRRGIIIKRKQSGMLSIFFVKKVSCPRAAHSLSADRK